MEEIVELSGTAPEVWLAVVAEKEEQRQRQEGQQQEQQQQQPKEQQQTKEQQQPREQPTLASSWLLSSSRPPTANLEAVLVPEPASASVPPVSAPNSSSVQPVTARNSSASLPSVSAAAPAKLAPAAKAKPGTTVVGRECAGCGNRTDDGFRPQAWRFIKGLPFCTGCGSHARRHPEQVPDDAALVPAGGLWPHVREARRAAAAASREVASPAAKRLRTQPAGAEVPASPLVRSRPRTGMDSGGDAHVPSASPVLPSVARTGDGSPSDGDDDESDGDDEDDDDDDVQGKRAFRRKRTSAGAARRLFPPTEPAAPPIAVHPPTTRLGASVSPGGASGETLVGRALVPDAADATAGATAPLVLPTLPSLVEAAAALPRVDLRQRDVGASERHDFDAHRGPERIRAGQFWALYDEDLVPSWYVRVVLVEQHPDNAQASFLAAIQFLDVAEDGTLVLDPECIIQDSAAAFSHQIHPVATESDDRYMLRPRRDEVWAVHTSRSAPDSNYGLYYTLILSDYDPTSGADVCWLERCSASRENVLWEGSQQVLKTLGNFSHPVLYWKDVAPEGHYIYEVDPAALRHPPERARPAPAPIRPASMLGPKRVPLDAAPRPAPQRVKERAMRTMRHVDASAATVADGPDAEGNEYYDTGKPTGLRTAYAECQHCLVTDDRMTMVECGQCHATRHVHCLRRPLLDAELFQDDDTGQTWHCSDCTDGITTAPVLDATSWPPLAAPDDGSIVVVRARTTRSDQVELLLQAANDGTATTPAQAWVPAAQLQAVQHTRLLAHFVSGSGLSLLLRSLDMRPTVVAIDESTIADRQKGVQRVVYRFAGNRSYFGITQLLGLFSEERLKSLERNCIETLNLAYEGKLPPAGVQQTVNQRRSKLFFGRRYYDYQSGRTTRLASDVAPIPPWLRDSIIAPVTGAVSEPTEFVDMVVMNFYHGAGASLGVHIDSKALFARPILSVRLFAPCVLSFGCRGMGMTHRQQAIPLARGCVTIMEGFAANKTKHCVRPADVNGLSVSIMLRKTVASKDTMAIDAVASTAALGEAGPDGAMGGSGPDVALGEAAPDVAMGGAGPDVAMGEAGADVAMGEAGVDVAVSIDNPDARSAVSTDNAAPRLAVSSDNSNTGSAVSIGNLDTGSAVAIDNPDAASVVAAAAAVATAIDGTTPLVVVFSDAMDVDAHEHPDVMCALSPPADPASSDEPELPCGDADGADDGGLVLDLS